MANPWSKKNPFMSLWLSGANSIANSARGKIAAEAKRQTAAAGTKATNDFIKLWSGKPTAPSAAAPKRKKRR